MKGKLMKKLIFALCLLAIPAQAGFLDKLKGKDIDNCRVTESIFNHSDSSIQIKCVKDGKTFEIKIKVEAELECGEFDCGQENVTEQVLILINQNLVDVK